MKSITNPVKQYKSGFTLIELLISITIIGILSAIAIPRLVNVVPQARDSQRLAALNEFVAAIESYNLEQGTYPTESFCLSGAGDVRDGYSVTEFIADYYKGQAPELQPVERAWDTCNDSVYYSKTDDGYVVSIGLERPQQANSLKPEDFDDAGEENVYKVVVR